jgi:hypothetical protein
LVARFPDLGHGDAVGAHLRDVGQESRRLAQRLADGGDDLVLRRDEHLRSPPPIITFVCVELWDLDAWVAILLGGGDFGSWEPLGVVPARLRVPDADAVAREAERLSCRRLRCLFGICRLPPARSRESTRLRLPAVSTSRGLRTASAASR